MLSWHITTSSSDLWWTNAQIATINEMGVKIALVVIASFQIIDRNEALCSNYPLLDFSQKSCLNKNAILNFQIKQKTKKKGSKLNSFAYIDFNESLYHLWIDHWTTLSYVVAIYQSHWAFHSGLTIFRFKNVFTS